MTVKHNITDQFQKCPRKISKFQITQILTQVGPKFLK